MSKTPKNERERIYDEVKHFEMTPEDAEKLAKAHGFEGFESDPDPSQFDPMGE